MLARFLYFLLVAFLVRMAWNAVAGWLTAQARRQMNATPGHSSERRVIHKGLMVRDPVCGLHLPEQRALTELRSGQRYHFCSERCRDSFLSAS
jgi:YHS domain-containing protein